MLTSEDLLLFSKVGRAVGNRTIIEWNSYQERRIFMYCPKCGKGAQPGAGFCMHCGQQLAGNFSDAGVQLGAAPSFPDPKAGQSKKLTWIAVGTALAMVLALFFGLQATGLLQIGAKNPKVAALRAEGRTDTVPLLQAEGSAPGGQSLGATATPISMPAEVRRWLEHLERIEKRKNDLSMRQLSQMAVLMKQMQLTGPAMGILNELEGEESGDLGPSSTAKTSFDSLRPEWNQLIADFRALPPPDECRPIADDYFRAISEIPGMNSDLASVLAGVEADPAKALESAMRLQNTSANVIDKNLGSADSRVGDICRKYETRKWFEIKTDVGGGLMGKFGL